MKEKILNTIYKKLAEMLLLWDREAPPFLKRNVFEKQFRLFCDIVSERLTKLKNEYDAILNSTDDKIYSKLIKIKREDFINNYYNWRRQYNGGRNNFKDSGKEEEIGAIYNDIIKSRLAILKNNVSSSDWYYIKGNWMIQFYEFANERKNEICSFPENIALANLFATKFFDRWRGQDTWPILREETEFKNYYENQNGEFMNLLDTSEKYLADINFSGFESFVVNVGNRTYTKGYYGWINSTFNVKNNGKEYSFLSSSKDEKGVEGKFINIFILQKKYLIKLSITLDEVQQTNYIIWKELEKLSVKNECEIHIAKHHGNETIIFDTRKDALEFERKIRELKEMRPSMRHA